MKTTLVILLCIALAEAKSYTNYHLLAVNPQTPEQLNALKELSTQNRFTIDFWIPPTTLNHTSEFLVSPEEFELVVENLENANAEFEILSDNIQQAIDEEKGTNKNYGLLNAFSNQGITDTYARYAQIVGLIKKFASKYRHATVFKYGTSYQGRGLYAIKFSTGPGKKGVFVEAGMHCREWIGIASTLKIIERMATNYRSDPEINQLLNMYDWIFVPVVNPDGYFQTQTENRLWRKNMRPVGSNCFGVDLNRNFDSGWGGPGSSSYPCSNVYHGTSILSEPESEALASLAISSNPLIGFFSVHTYSQLILTPYGYTNKKPADSPELTSLAIKAADAIERLYGRRFQVGTPPDILYIASGGAYDWAKLRMRVKYSYAFELRPSGNTRQGFILPANQIEPSSKELFAALKTFAYGFQ